MIVFYCYCGSMHKKEPRCGKSFCVVQFLTKLQLVTVLFVPLKPTEMLLIHIHIFTVLIIPCV